MPSELERIAGRLRFLSDQAQQHRRPVLEASQTLRDAANVVGKFRFEQPEGRPAITPPPNLAAHLAQAAERAQNAVAPLTQTAELLRTFAARLAAGGGDSTTRPGGSTPTVPPTRDPSPAAATSVDVRSDSGTGSGAGESATGSPPPSRTGSLAASRYGRYPTTTAVGSAPGNRS